ncbi:MAG: DUF5804 family protein [Methanoregula sp.]|nr:DUF5804 family protein [Methanoregula sp.]
MNILLIQRENIDLHHILFVSETSRLALRFYHPRKLPCGVMITVTSLGSALSLVSELRWYVRRYMQGALFEVEKGIFCTRTLAQDVYYERAVILGKPWGFRRLYGFRDGKLISNLVMSPGSSIDEYHQEVIGIDQPVEVWCTEEELGEKIEPEPLDDVSGELEE